MTRLLHGRLNIDESSCNNQSSVRSIEKSCRIWPIDRMIHFSLIRAGNHSVETTQSDLGDSVILLYFSKKSC
jgi:hypothetical protein